MLRLTRTHLQALVLLQRLGSDVVAAVQVVRNGEADPVGLVAGLQLQHRGPGVHKAGDVSELDLQRHALQVSLPRRSLKKGEESSR